MPRRYLASTPSGRVLAILERSGLLEHVDLDEENGQLQLQHESVQGRGAQRGQSASTRPPRQRGGLWGWDEYYDLYASRPIPARDREGLERLVRYVARPPLSLRRLSELDGLPPLHFHLTAGDRGIIV
ncbi:MAG: hypothetical protein HN348_25365 [Proteobacteria bacterium]|nr:hypothetical protein [Pseudomonadota bacterium]